MSQPQDLDHFFIGGVQQPEAESALSHKNKVEQAVVTVVLSDGRCFYYLPKKEKTDVGPLTHGASYVVNSNGTLTIFHTRELYKDGTKESRKTKSRVITFGPSAWVSVKGAEG